MKLKFRQLRPDEIRPKAIANKGGVTILLWKDPKANLSIIDDAVGLINRSVTYSDDGKRCRLAIRIENEWLVQDGCAFDGSPDNAANDALNHAGFAWGIGKALYTAPSIFIYKDKLKKYSCVDDEPVCHDDFKVTDIQYDGERITSVTLELCEYGKPYAKMTFGEVAPNAPTQNKAKDEKQPQKEKTEEKAKEKAFTDDEVILIGNCRGKTYGEVKETETFKSFLEWAQKTNRSYADPKAAEQFKRFQKMAC